MKRRIVAITTLSVLLLCGAVWARVVTVVVGQGAVTGGGGTFTQQDSSQPTIDADATFAWHSSAPDGAISWTTSSAYTLTKIAVKIKRTATGLPGGTLTAYIHGDAAPACSVSPLTNGTSSNTVSTTDLTTSYVTYEFTFPSGVSLNNATRYWIVVTSSVTDSDGYDNYFSFGSNAAGTQSFGYGDASADSITVDDSSATNWIITYSGGS